MVVKILQRQISFPYSIKARVSVAFFLGTFLSILLIFLEPFDTNQYQSNYKTLFLLGFGIILSATSFCLSLIENVWYKRIKKVWTIGNEALMIASFFVVSGTTLYLYNRLVVNDSDYSIESHWWYYTHIVLAMIPIIAPLLVYLRQRFGEKIIPLLPNSYIIVGENKNERLEVHRDDLLCVQAIENYIDIHYMCSNKGTCSKTFRQTLSNAHSQAPFLKKSHRSYLVNTSKISEIKGNSQNAKIFLRDFEKEIPLSKSQYKTIKAQVVLT